MNTDAVAKIAMLKDSVRCLAFGLLGLLPLVGLPFILLALSMAIPVFGLIGFCSLAGLPFAVLALWIGGRVRLREKQYWNAAKPFRISGALCGGAGLVIWAAVACLIFYNLDAWIAALSN